MQKYQKTGAAPACGQPLLHAPRPDLPDRRLNHAVTATDFRFATARGLVPPAFAALAFAALAFDTLAFDTLVLAVRDLPAREGMLHKPQT